MEEMDDSVGKVLATLAELGLEDNTIVYFTSDQGGHLEAVEDNGERIGGYNRHFKGQTFLVRKEGINGKYILRESSFNLYQIILLGTSHTQLYFCWGDGGNE